MKTHNRTVYEMTKTVETEGLEMTSQYGAYALRAGLARLHACMRMHTPTCPCTHMHALTPSNAHTDQYVIRTALPPQQWFRERVSVLHYCLYFYGYLNMTVSSFVSPVLLMGCSNVVPVFLKQI